MKFAFILALTAATAAPFFPANSSWGAPQSSETPRRFPLRGVIVAMDRERSLLTVKHEAIPGLMRAMTMLFRVEPGTLASVNIGQAITATLSRQNDEWWLHHVKPVPPKKE